MKRVCQGVLPCGVLLPQMVCEEVWAWCWLRAPGLAESGRIQMNRPL